jgi:transposase
VFRRRELSVQTEMVLKDHSLRQLDEAYLRGLPREELNGLSLKLLEDLKEARERLNQNASNSSVPPSARAPWLSDDEGAEDEQLEKSAQPEDGFEERAAPAPGEPAQDESSEPAQGPVSSAEDSEPQPERKAGKQRGAPGHGRTQRLTVTEVVHHRVTRCGACGREGPEGLAGQSAWTGFYTLDIEVGEAMSPGLALTNTLHRYYELTCTCGHVTREEPYRAPRDGLWEKVDLTEWRLAGPMLCALIVALSYRSRMSRTRVREFLWDWMGLSLSVGTLQRCIEEAGRASAPVEDQLVAAVLDSGLLHADETTHKEHGQTLWLWVFVTTSTVLFYIGYRTKEMVDNLLGEDYAGWYDERRVPSVPSVSEAPAVHGAPAAQGQGLGREPRGGRARVWPGNRRAVENADLGRLPGSGGAGARGSHPHLPKGAGRLPRDVRADEVLYP